MATDPHLAALFEDTYAAAGHHPHRALLAQLLANATGGLLAGGVAEHAVAPEALAAALAWALQQGSGGSQAAASPLPSPSPSPDAPGGGGSGGGAGPSGPVHISLICLFLATALVAVNGLVSLWLHLGLHNKLAVATVR